MPILKTPPKQVRSATIQVRVEEDINLKLRKYAEFIDCSAAYVVSEALRLLFNKDSEFREWLAQYANESNQSQSEESTVTQAAKTKEVEQRSGLPCNLGRITP